VTLSILNSAKIFYLCHLAKPATDRAIYRLLQQGSVRKIVELGIGTAERALQMLEIAASQAPIAEMQYIGMDLFEARSETDGPGLSFKEAYRTLQATGAKIRLMPGDPLNTMMRSANAIGTIDLLIVSAGIDMSQARAWWFAQRLLHDQTQVCVEQRSQSGQLTLEWKTRDEVAKLATATNSRAAA
jgi:hypothetical protein